MDATVKLMPPMVDEPDDAVCAPVAGSVLPTILRRRSIRRFLPDQIPLSDIDEIIELALWAPSPHNSQPWRITHLKQTTKKQLAAAMGDQLRRALELASVLAAEIDAQVRRSRSRIEAAPHAFLCSLVPEGLRITGSTLADALEMQMAVQSVGAFLQTVFLVATTRGIGSCWMAAPMYCPDIVRSVLALPDSFQPQALVLLGYPDTEGNIRPRRPILQVVDIK